MFEYFNQTFLIFFEEAKSYLESGEIDLLLSSTTFNTHPINFLESLFLAVDVEVMTHLREVAN
jgi:hypothetical protein